MGTMVIKFYLSAPVDGIVHEKFENTNGERSRQNTGEQQIPWDLGGVQSLHRLEGKSDFKKGRMLGTTPLAHGAGQPKPKAQSQPSPRNRKGEASLERRVIDHYLKTELLFVGDVFKRQS
jgi:hypothetical protein